MHLKQIKLTEPKVPKHNETLMQFIMFPTLE